MDIRKLACTTGVALATGFGTCAAMADSGLYIGGGIGQSNIEDNTGTPGGVPFDETDTAWRAFAGYNIDLIPLVKFAAELGWRDLGNPSGSAAGIPAEYKVDGFDYSVLAGVGLGPVDLFGRVGGYQYDLTKTVGGVSRDFDGTAPLYGVGVWFTVAGIGLRAEYDLIDIDELDNAEMLSISAFYKF